MNKFKQVGKILFTATMVVGLVIWGYRLFEFIEYGGYPNKLYIILGFIAMMLIFVVNIIVANLPKEYEN